MRETKIYCDHCGKVLDVRLDYPEQEVGLMDSEQADLCSECLEKLDEIIRVFCKKGGKADA